MFKSYSFKLAHVYKTKTKYVKIKDRIDVGKQ